MQIAQLETPSLTVSGSSTPEVQPVIPLVQKLATPRLTLNSIPAQVICQVRTRIPTPYGQFYLHVYQNNLDDKEHLALVFGNNIKSKSLNEDWENDSETQRIIRGADPSFLPVELKQQDILVRIHSECFTGETVGSVRCDCGQQLDLAMRQMHKDGQGVILYLRQEGRGIGLLNKMRAYNLQDLGYDTVDANLMLGLPADARDYNVGASILNDLSINQIRLLTNNPLKVEQLKKHGVTISDRVSMIPKEWASIDLSLSSGNLNEYTEIDGYLRTKISRMGHLLIPPGI